MGAIAPTAKRLWGRCPEVAPTGILLCEFLSNSRMSLVKHYHGCTQPRCTVKITNDFSLKMRQKRLAAGLRPNPLGELNRSPNPWMELRGRCRSKGRGKTGGRGTAVRGGSETGKSGAGTCREVKKRGQEEERRVISLPRSFRGVA